MSMPGGKVGSTAAHGILAGLTHRRGARETVELEPIDDPLHADDVAGRCATTHASTRSREPGRVGARR